MLPPRRDLPPSVFTRRSPTVARESARFRCQFPHRVENFVGLPQILKHICNRCQAPSRLSRLPVHRNGDRNQNRSNNIKRQRKKHWIGTEQVIRPSNNTTDQCLWCATLILIPKHTAIRRVAVKQRSTEPRMATFYHWLGASGSSPYPVFQHFSNTNINRFQ